MSIRVLIGASQNIYFHHDSGEVEISLLKLGFSLLGIQCDYAGIESDDFNSYDLFLAFSLKPDILNIVSKISPGKNCIIFPQTEDYSSLNINSLQQLSNVGTNFYIQTRNEFENSFYASNTQINVLYIPGWFNKPFIWNGIDSKSVYLEFNKKYGLAFLGQVNLNEIYSINSESIKYNYGMILVTNNQMELISNQKNIIFKKKVKYGSQEWFEYLNQCSYFFEPNDRLTCSLLEALWLGKDIISPHAETLNKMLGYEIIFSSIGSMLAKSDRKINTKKYIVKYEAVNVASDLIKYIFGNGNGNENENHR